MGTYRQLLYHLVFEPYKREKVFLEKNQNRLYAYIRQIIENKKCKLYAINGIEDHIHLLFLDRK